jgi:hypothetical protein
MSYYLKKLRAFFGASHSDDKLSFIDSIIIGSFVIGALSLALIWWLI